MERDSLFQDDLTEERLPTPADRADTSDSIAMDPDDKTDESQQKGIREPNT